MAHSRFQILIQACCVIVLVAAAVRLYDVNRTLLDRRSAADRWAEFWPVTGSLENIAYSLDENGTESSSGAVVVFVVHGETLDRDVSRWNGVSRHIGEQGGDVLAVGICDVGFTCEGARSKMSSRLVNALDPYQARIVAKADSLGLALVYVADQLVGKVKVDQDVQAIAREVLNSVRDR